MAEAREVIANRSEYQWLFIAAIIGALAVRIAVWPIHSSDIDKFLLPWFAYIVEHGHWRALADKFSDYEPAYLYLIDVVSFFDGHASRVVLLKLITLPFEAFTAVLVYKTVRLLAPAREEGLRLRTLTATVAILMLPTVLLNGAVWGQCDVIFSSFLLAAVYSLLRDRPWLTTINFGIALAFKLQAVFLAPFLLLMLLRGKLKLRHFWPVLVVWAIIALPVVIAGRPIANTLRILIDQTQTYQILGCNVANPWIFLNNAVPYHVGVRIGVAAGAFATLAYAWIARRQRNCGTEWMLSAATFSLVLMPFTLPCMHDRYFFPAEIFAVVLAASQLRLLLPALLLQCASLVTYTQFLTGGVVGLSAGSIRIALLGAVLATGSVIVFFARQFVRLSHEDSSGSTDIADLEIALAACRAEQEAAAPR